MNINKRGTAVTALLLVGTAVVSAANTTEAPDTLGTDSIFREQKLGEVRVTGMGRRHTQAAMIAAAKESQLVVSNVSAQEIKKTQDSNAGEVIRRVPGVSLIDEKFVMVRGLSQRYNNVWMNGGAVPSSEADSRAFSFDIIPSSQIDNLVIVKSPSPEYPADFSGGFIQINTKDIPSSNSFSVSVGGNFNDATHARGFSYAKGSGTDFLGFDNGLRSLSGGINATLKPVAGEHTADLAANGLNNDWRVRRMTPVSDLRLGADWSRRWTLGDWRMGMVGAVNYTSETRTYADMQNNLFGIYDVANDRRNYLRQSVDDQYNRNVRLGGLLNLALVSPGGAHRLELKSVLNQLATDRYTRREGISAQSNHERSAEYYYRSRTTCNLQLTGKHAFGDDHVEWGASYAYANRRMPDRRRYLVDDALTDNGELALTTGNDINREFTQLDEHIVSANANGRHTFHLGSFSPEARAGVYGEYRSRDYTTRQFIYNWNPADNALPRDFRNMDMETLLSTPDYFGAKGLYLIEEMHLRNNYSGHNTLGAAYAAASLPFGRLSVYAGVRFEFNQLELVANTRDYEVSHQSRYYRNRDLYPSLNSVYRIDGRNQVRLSYGKSVNRPEFREVSTSVFYDFDLASSVKGNADLKSCYVHNVDLRYEFYPSAGEQITLAGFYKHFDNPIEWTYTVAGGTDLVYSFENAKSADNLGVELDIRKDLSFIGLSGFSWSFNGALIHSRVHFPDGSRFDNRPMQGQSPYLVNTGLFWRDRSQLSVALLYNRIGKRIIGVGRSEGSTGSEDNARIPDSYEMPRNSFDLTMQKNFGEHLELRLAVKDLLAEKVVYKQFADVHMGDGSRKEVEQVTREYRPGRNVSLMLSYRF